MTFAFKKPGIDKLTKDQRVLLFIWIAFLSFIVIIASVIADFNMGYRQFKLEMAEHWVDYQPDPNSQGSANSSGTFSATALERTYNTLARSLNDVSVRITGARLINGVSDQMHGSGVIISEQYVLTNYHVIENTTDIHITVYTPLETSYRAQVVSTDPLNDLALLAVNTNKALPSASLGNSDTVDAGDMVFAMGNAFGSGNIFTTGVICGRSQSFVVDGREYRNMIRTETYMYPGSSGGPLANINGEIIGINTAIYNPQGKFTGISFAMPINRAMSLLKNGRVPGYSTMAAKASPAAYSLAA